MNAFETIVLLGFAVALVWGAYAWWRSGDDVRDECEDDADGGMR